MTPFQNPVERHTNVGHYFILIQCQYLIRADEGQYLLVSNSVLLSTINTNVCSIYHKQQKLSTRVEQVSTITTKH